MSESPFANEPILLWGTPGALHCSLKRLAEGAPYEITVFSGGHVVKRMTFERHQDAANFAIVEMRGGTRPGRGGGVLTTADPSSEPSDPSAS
jgi:hypothetical protein